MECENCINSNQHNYLIAEYVFFEKFCNQISIIIIKIKHVPNIRANFRMIIINLEKNSSILIKAWDYTPIVKYHLQIIKNTERNIIPILYIAKAIPKSNLQSSTRRGGSKYTIYLNASERFKRAMGHVPGICPQSFHKQYDVGDRAINLCTKSSSDNLLSTSLELPINSTILLNTCKPVNKTFGCRRVTNKLNRQFHVNL